MIPRDLERGFDPIELSVVQISPLALADAEISVSMLELALKNRCLSFTLEKFRMRFIANRKQ